MKGTFFNKPLEFNLNINGESWSQGETITGSFNITNHSQQDVDLSKIACHLCFCTNKKFKAKDPKAIELLESILLAPDQTGLNFEFTLNKNCPITDSTGSLYVLFGDITNPFDDAGFLQLNIVPINPIKHFTQIFEQFYRFKLKAFKNKKTFIEAIVSPPDSKEWASIQKMIIQFHMIDDDLHTKFIVNLKKLDFSGSHHKTKDEKREFKKVLSKKQYELYGLANQEGIKSVIDELLSEIKIKPII